MNIYQLCDSARQDTPQQFYESQVRSRCSVAVAAHDKTGQITAIAILIASELFLFAVCLLLFRRANAPSDSGPSESLSFQISWRSKTWREKTVAACLHAIVFTNNYLSVGLFRRVFLIVLAAASFASTAAWLFFAAVRVSYFHRENINATLVSERAQGLSDVYSWAAAFYVTAPVATLLYCVIRILFLSHLARFVVKLRRTCSRHLSIAAPASHTTRARVLVLLFSLVWFAVVGSGIAYCICCWILSDSQSYRALVLKQQSSCRGAAECAALSAQDRTVFLRVLENLELLHLTFLQAVQYADAFVFLATSIAYIVVVTLFLWTTAVLSLQIRRVASSSVQNSPRADVSQRSAERLLSSSAAAPPAPALQLLSRLSQQFSLLAVLILLFFCARAMYSSALAVSNSIIATCSNDLCSPCQPWLLAFNEWIRRVPAVECVLYLFTEVFMSLLMLWILFQKKPPKESESASPPARS